MKTVAQPGKRGFVVDLPLTDYGSALSLQRRLVDLRTAGVLEAEIFLFLEHFPVFTMGRRGGLENLRVSRSFLRDLGIATIETERGGDITYHGPGQLVVYPIVNLLSFGMGVVEYVSLLETAMIQTVARWGIQAGTDPVNRGIWAVGRKLGSIGISVRKSVAFHGLALNGNTDLKPFGWIHPCGLKEVEMISMAHLIGSSVDMSELRREMKSQLASALGLEMVGVPSEAFFRLLSGFNENGHSMDAEVPATPGSGPEGNLHETTTEKDN